jgi:hypothetical protein
LSCGSGEGENKMHKESKITKVDMEKFLDKLKKNKPELQNIIEKYIPHDEKYYYNELVTGTNKKDVYKLTQSLNEMSNIPAKMLFPHLPDKKEKIIVKKRGRGYVGIVATPIN